jgi:hypothetical protein
MDASTFAYDFFFHRAPAVSGSGSDVRLCLHPFPQEAIDLVLVPRTFPPQPVQHVGVQTDGNRALHRRTVFAAHRGCPGAIRGLGYFVRILQAGFNFIQAGDVS